MRRNLLMAFILMACTFIPSWAQDVSEEDLSPHSDATLITEAASIQPGIPFTLGLHMRMDEGWHSYWTNPGDSGEPTEIVWGLPEGFTTGDMQWPYPHRIDLPPLRTYGYSNEVVLLTEITPPVMLEPGTSVTIEGIAYWLICADICLPAEADISITLPVQNIVPDSTPEADLFTQARSELPKSIGSWTVSSSGYSGSYVLQITPPEGTTLDLEDAHFFAYDNTTIEHAAPQPVSKEGNSYLIALQESEYATSMADRLAGALVAAEGKTLTDNGLKAVHIDVAVQEAGATALPATTSSPSLAWLLIMAFAGGLLLNLMPCVFPVLSLKILGFTNHSDSSSASMRGQGLVFGAGVIASFWVLAGLLLALRAAGSQIGWGFQLQSPLFVAGMAVLFFAIGLNLMGVFEMGSALMRKAGELGQHTSDNHTRRSFFDGVLATLVATPCTAPFMGAALGAAIVLPAVQALLIFTMLGVGMATPYVVLSMMPGVLKRLPRPGPWMETMKQVLAFPMFATTIWLVWVFGQQTGLNGIALLLSGLLLLGMALWVIGRWPGIQITTRVRVVTRSIASLIALAALSMVYLGATSESASLPTSSAESSDSAWLSFSQEEVSRLRAAGQPVFIDFTAAWCLTCQVNKRTALNTAAVQNAFKQKGVTLFQADWTNRDAEITEALEAHGRSGVPLYVLYSGPLASPQLLPEILTERILLDALDAIPDASLASFYHKP